MHLKESEVLRADIDHIDVEWVRRTLKKYWQPAGELIKM